MQSPPLPPDEAFRLEALRSLCVLDTPQEERFDRITRSAAHLFQVPIALVSLVDSARQWFKSRQGLDAAETSREVSFCAHAILSREIFVVEDTLLDARFMDNPLVTGPPSIRFYAGLPLKGPGNALIGTLCLIDRVPRKFKPADRDALRDMAAWAERELSQSALQEALRQASEGEIFFALNPAVACIADMKGRFRKVNPAFGAVLGVTEAQLLGTPFWDLIHPEDVDEVGRAIEQLKAGRPVRSQTVRFRGADGGYRTLEWDVTARDELMFAVARDITELRSVRASEARLKAVLDRSPDFIGISDAQGRPLYWNAAYRRIRGLTPDEPLPEGLHVKDTHTEASARQLLEMGIPTALVEGTWAGESRYRDGEGGEVPVSQVLMAHRDEAGQIEFLSSVARDISSYHLHDEALRAGHRLLARALAEQRASEARYRVLVDASPDLIARHGPDGVFLDINAAASRVLGYAREEMVGRTPADFVPEEDLQGMLAFFRDSRAGRERGFVRFRVGHRDGREVWLESRGERLTTLEGRVEEVVIASRDMTEHLELERMKELFLSTASHELRTPLASIRGSLELLAEAAGGTLPEKAARLAETAHANAVRLSRIVDDILDVDRVKHGRMPLAPRACHLHLLARQAVEAVQAFGDSFGVALPCGPWPEDAEAFADPDRVVQILVNLLSNAVKYSPPGGPVLTRITSEGMDRIVEVEDRGPGIPEAFHARIFEQFAQAGGPAQQPGSGLGLSISKSFAEAMGGSLAFESRPGRTVFRLRLPAAVVTRAAADADASLPAVLHVEDDVAVGNLVAAALDGLVRVETVRTLDQARKLLDGTAWSLVVLDSRLPDGAGLDLLPELRTALGDDLPVILFTGEDSAAESATGLAHVFLKGSCGPAEIRRVVGRILAGG